MSKSLSTPSPKGLAVAVLTALILLAGTGIGFCKGPKTIAVFPFEMNSSQDLGFLQNGLFSMLSSRLSDAGKVDVLDRETVDKALAAAKTNEDTKGVLNEAKARIIGGSLGVDYVLFGSLTNFGESVSLDAKMVDLAGKKETLAFFEQSNAMGDVIPLVNSFAGDINYKMFNRNIDNKLYARQQAEEPAAPGGLQYAGGAGVYGGGMMSMPTGQGFATHLQFNDIIRAMAVGDLNKDGTEQVVTATDSNLQIYSLKGNMLAEEQTLEYDSFLRIVGLDVADINGNGFPEIFVTALTIHKDTLASFIIEFDGTSYVTLADGEARYYRVVDGENGNKVLLTQERNADPFTGSIYFMSAVNNAYDEGKRLRLPRGTSVLALAKGPVRSDGAEEYLTINRHDRLVAVGDTGSMVWESSGKYGKTNNVWLMPNNDTDGTYRERIYLNPRIIFHEIGDDGKKKAIVIRNSELGGGAFGRYKKFKEGHIEIMAWNGIALAPVFQTMPVQGWISDFAITDLDGDGVEELLVSVVSRTKLSILSKDKSSNIISYKLK